MYQGISILQPWHQVAQKSSTTTLPLKSDNLMAAPVESSKVKSVAVVRADGAVMDAGKNMEPIKNTTDTAIAKPIARLRCVLIYPPFLQLLITSPEGCTCISSLAGFPQKRLARILEALTAAIIRPLSPPSDDGQIFAPGIRARGLFPPVRKQAQVRLPVHQKRFQTPERRFAPPDLIPQTPSKKQR